MIVLDKSDTVVYSEQEVKICQYSTSALWQWRDESMMTILFSARQDCIRSNGTLYS